MFGVEEGVGNFICGEVQIIQWVKYTTKNRIRSGRIGVECINFCRNTKIEESFYVSQ